MTIPASGTFDYEADFTEESFGDSNIVLMSSDRGRRGDRRLVGLHPKLRFSQDRLVIFTNETRGATVRHASFLVGDAVSLVAQLGDRLYVSRTGAGAMGISVLRRERLILAIGAVTAIPLGEGFQVVAGSDGSWEKPSSNTWLDFSVDAKHLIMRGREFSDLGKYYLYVERCWEFGEPDANECASICFGDDPATRIAAMRSAVLLGHAALKMVEWDNTERFI